jgi:rhodanese-related sulfurtransferase
MKEISPADAHARWKAGELNIIDVREQDEYDRTHVEGMTLIPMSQITRRLHDVPSGALAILCRSGGRSGRVCDHLNALGDYGEVLNVEGGILGWAASGLPYVGPEPE